MRKTPPTPAPDFKAIEPRKSILYALFSMLSQHILWNKASTTYHKIAKFCQNSIKIAKIVDYYSIRGPKFWFDICFVYFLNQPTPRLWRPAMQSWTRLGFSNLHVNFIFGVYKQQRKWLWGLYKKFFEKFTFEIFFSSK